MENEGYAERVAAAFERMERRAKSVSRPIFHLTPVSGTLADPNGLIKVGDTYHVFYITNPLGCEVEGRTPSVWVHLTTTDLVSWHREPVAIWPDHPRDRNGVYSGSALLRDGRLHLYYTGNVRHEGNHDYVLSGREQNVMRVSSLDGEKGQRFGEKTLLMTNDDFPADLTQHVRDPQMVERGGHVYLLLGARTRDDVGCVLVYQGDDLERFSLVGRLETEESFGYMWECPDLATLSGRDFLLCCPQGIPHERNRFQNSHQCGYFPVEGDPLAAPSEATLGAFEQWDFGFDLYAARTLRDGERTLLVGWLGMAETAYGATPSRADGWDQVIAMPRELVWQDGRIYQRPVAELARLRGERVALDGPATLHGRHFELDLSLREGSELRLRLREDCELAWDAAAGELVLSMGPVCGAGRDVRRMRLAALERLQVFVDDTTLEVFVNDGAATMTSRLFGASDECRVEGLLGTGSFWEMRGYSMEG